ncbi:hypothetical protein [Psychroflexus halocasei]|uniref:Lipocalin-like domain-containing protein n=1 Tax=Psychroflexus halocasei TaxID=908615 RepID=A0A1H4AG77_9FLAO|nr:hypothetical protein [Psychroflexus halocasei]SEA34950.1 hypothetical protein SAMN05421540_10525 [Psychroflexus halocasei]
MKNLKLKHQQLLFLVLISLSLSCSMLIYSQNLEGHWIAAGDKGPLLQFTKDSLLINNLDKRIDAKPYFVKDDLINVGESKVLKLKFINHNRLRAVKDQSNAAKDIIKLQPTKTNLTKPEIQNTEYFIPNDPHHKTFKFNKAFDDSNKIIKLEKIGSTYFLSQYINDDRKNYVPIESLTSDEIVINISPEKKMVLKAKNTDGSSVNDNTSFSSRNGINIAEIIIGKWFYKRLAGRPSLSKCTKKTFFLFKKDLSLQIKPYAENFDNGKCIEGSIIDRTYEILENNQIKVFQNGKSEIWKIQALTKTELVVEKNDRVLTLTKE